MLDARVNGNAGVWVRSALAPSTMGGAGRGGEWWGRGRGGGGPWRAMRGGGRGGGEGSQLQSAVDGRVGLWPGAGLSDGIIVEDWPDWPLGIQLWRFH